MADARAQSLDRWKRIKAEAERADRAERRPSGAEAPRRTLLERDYMAHWLERWGVSTGHMLAAGINGGQAHRWTKGTDTSTVSPGLIPQLGQALGLAGLGLVEVETAIGELNDWTITPQERALLLAFRFWLRRRRNLESLPLDVADVPAFDSSTGCLIWVRRMDLDEQRTLDAGELGRRIEAVTFQRDSVVTFGGDDGMQRDAMVAFEEHATGPLLDWWQESAFVARHWRELSAHELHEYMTQGPLTQVRLLTTTDEPLDRIRAALRNRRPATVPWVVEDVRDPRDAELDVALDSLFD